MRCIMLALLKEGWQAFIKALLNLSLCQCHDIARESQQPVAEFVFGGKQRIA